MPHKVEYHIEFAQGITEERLHTVSQLLAAYVMENNLRPFELCVQHEAGRGMTDSRIELGFDEAKEDGALSRLATPEQRVSEINTLLSRMRISMCGPTGPYKAAKR